MRIFQTLQKSFENKDSNEKQNPETAGQNSNVVDEPETHKNQGKPVITAIQVIRQNYNQDDFKEALSRRRADQVVLYNFIVFKNNASQRGKGRTQV